jgi:hypothetical protein
MAARSLGREIAVALIFKAIALAALYFVFFSGAHKLVVTSRDTAGYLFQSRSASHQYGEEHD